MNKILIYIKKKFLISISDFLCYITDPELGLNDAKRTWNFLKLFYIKSSQEKVLQLSATLTYITLLGFIPFLIFIFNLLPMLPFLNFQSRLEEVIFKNFLPSSADQVSIYISQIMEQRVAFNIVSFIAMLITSYSLFKVISGAFDRVLLPDVEFKQDAVNMVLRFFGTIIFGFIITLILFSSTSVPFISGMLKVPFLNALATYLIPFIAQFLIILFLYLFMPTIKVKRSALLKGAIITTIFWILGKVLFDYYILNLTHYKAIYGVLALIPIFLFWMYVNWVIILGGIVLVSIFEYKDHAILKRAEVTKRIRMTLEFYVDDKLRDRVEKFLPDKDVLKLLESYERTGIKEKEKPNGETQ
jgi:membrane protein